MREESIKDFGDFIRHTEVFDLIHDLTVFRGQPVKGKLVPSIARKNPAVDTTEQEKKLLQQLRLMGASLLPSLTRMPLSYLCLPSTSVSKRDC